MIPVISSIHEIHQAPLTLLLLNNNQTQTPVVFVSGTQTNQLGDDWYEIDRVTSRRTIAGKPHFLVHWKDGSRSYEPEDNVSDYTKAQYYARCQARRKPRRHVS